MSLIAPATGAGSKIDTSKAFVFTSQSREISTGFGVFLRPDNTSSVETRMSVHAGQKNQIREAESDPNCPKENLTCLNISDGSNQLENLDSDLKVCNCLEERFNVRSVSTTELSGEALAERERKINEGKLMASLMHFEKMFAGRRDALLLEAHFISDEQKNLLSKIAITKEAKETLKGIIESYKGKVSRKFYRDAWRMLGSYNYEEGRSKTTTVLENLNSETKRADSCFPFSEYLKITMIPESSAFWKDLLVNKELTDFRSWDYWDLSMKYRETQGEEKEAIKAKLDFLNRNPSIKTLFSSNDENLKKEVYKKIRASLDPTSGCVNSSSCRGRFFSKGGNLQEALKEFHNHPELKENHLGHSYVDLIKEISAIGVSSFNPPGIPALRLAFSEGDVRYNQCHTNADDELAPKCAEIFKNYCGEIRSQEGQFRDNFAKDNSYDDSWVDDLVAEPSENQGYLAFQDKMCDKLSRTHLLSTKVFNFKTFKTDYCKSNNCELLSDGELFKIFIKDTRPTNKFFNENNELVSGAEDFELIAKASSENKTFVAEVDRDFIKQVNDSGNKLKAFDTAVNDNFSISDLLAESSRPINKDKNNEFSMNTEDLANDIPLEYLSSELIDDKSLTSEGTLSVPGQSFLSNNHYVEDTAISDARNELEELKKEEASIRNEITQVKTDISSSSSKEVNNALEMRLENLERLLAEKEKSSQSYQSLISKLIDKQKESNKSLDETDDNADKVETVASIIPQRKVVASNLATRPTIVSEDHQSSQRAPASVENFSTSSAAMGGGAASLAQTMFNSSASRGGGRFNGALLSKYGIMVQENPGSTVSVAQEVEGTHFSAIGSFKNASDLPLEVSQKAFERFKVNDLTALQELYKDSIEKLDQDVVKIFVSSEESNETLEFYAIKEDGKVVFQPIRKTKLSDLQNALTQY